MRVTDIHASETASATARKLFGSEPFAPAAKANAATDECAGCECAVPPA